MEKLQQKMKCVIVLLSLCFSVVGAKDKNVQKADELPVNEGSPTCISNCSKNDPGGATLQCSIQECGTFENSNVTAEKPDITSIFFEMYKDPVSGEAKLALRAEWSPEDDATVENTSGYEVEISDGFTSYHKCYNIITAMSFHQNVQDVFYNDCFGKARGTKVLLGSKIRVSISALPLWFHDINDTKTYRDIVVPDCSYDKFLPLSECEAERNTRTDCSSNCTTYSVGRYDGKTYPIYCSISKQQSVFKSGAPEICPKVNRTAENPPSVPHWINISPGWYKYIDVVTNETKLALNFSWGPGDDASIASLIGYYIEILHQRTDSPDLTNYNKCYSIHTNLEYDKHSKAEFFHECYGRDNLHEVEPKSQYLVHVNSLPRPDGDADDKDYISDTIIIPSCADPEMQDVTACAKDNNLRLEGDVEEIFCANRSMKYKYHVSPEYGDRAMVTFCEKGSVPTHMCKNTLILNKDLVPSNTLYNLSLPSSANLSINYSIFVSGNMEKSVRHYDFPDFSHCVPAVKEETYVLITVLLVIGILIVIALVFAFCFLYRKECDDNKMEKFFPCCFSKKRNGQVTQYTASIEDGTQGQVNPLTVPVPVPPAPAPLSSNVRVYVLFMEDHELHINVIHWFCSYLRKDLGLDVHVHIWETKICNANPAAYMMTNLKNADKVIIICSEGTRKCLDRANELDKFTPAVRNIINEAFVGKNPGKFLVGYFDYSSPEDVPELLRDQTMMYCSLFKLMKQFEQFYFRVRGIEQYQEGGIQRIEKIAFDRYYDPKLTSCGLKLKEAIDRMREYVIRNPTWYTDSQGTDMAVVDLPPEPAPAPSIGTTLDNPIEGLASINLLHLSHPPQIPDATVTGAKRKKMNNSIIDPRIDQVSAVEQQQRRDPRETKPKYVSDFSAPSQDTTPSMEESFMVPETEVEDLSLDSKVPSQTRGPLRPTENPDFTPNPPGVGYHPGPTEHSMGVHEQFFEPEFFSGLSDKSIHPLVPTQDDPDSYLQTILPSNETQVTFLPSGETGVTRVGMPESVEVSMLQEPANLMSLDDVERHEEETAPNVPPESGVFTLANIDEIEGCDFEDEFKSINMLT